MLRSLTAAVLVSSGWMITSYAMAQSAGNFVGFPGGYAPGQSPCSQQIDGSCVPVSNTTPLPVGGKQEAFALASANAAGFPQTVFGGNYALAQSCQSYNMGSLALRYRGPDGGTMLTLLSKTASDSAGSTLISLGSNAVVDVVLPTGSAGCDVTLARVP